MDEPLQVGDQVRIIEGVLAGHTGVVVSGGHAASENWIAVQVNLLGKTTIVEMHSDVVEKA